MLPGTVFGAMAAPGKLRGSKPALRAWREPLTWSLRRHAVALAAMKRAIMKKDIDHGERYRMICQKGVGRLAICRLAMVWLVGSILVSCSPGRVAPDPSPGVSAAASANVQFASGLDAFNAGDYATAHSAWQSAAEANNAEAENALGWLYAGGLGVPQNHEEAVKWYQRAASRGHGGAQLNLANHYYYGLGVPQNDAEAARLFGEASRQGYIIAQNNLARMYKEGRGVPRRPDLAARWMQQAAEGGFPPAQNSLGLMYFEGDGVPQDYQQAWIWFELAVRNGVPGAEHNRDFVASLLSDDQRAAAEEQVSRWQPRVGT
jgi:TPR repeat protein